MAGGSPVICSRIRGNTDLIDAEDGFFFDPSGAEGVKDYMRCLLKAGRESMGFYNIERIRIYSLDTVKKPGSRHIV